MVSRAAPFSRPTRCRICSTATPAASRSAQVLIIGAGSGNDVSRALAWGADRVDAVEIDPVIHGLGNADHPDHPYDDPRVFVHLNDGRNFLRSTNKQYDLIIYALVDSLVLHSSYSNIRLESYLFTKQAFDDVKKRLKPGGVFVMYNYFRQGWIVSRLENDARPAVRRRNRARPQPAAPRHAPTRRCARSATSRCSSPAPPVPIKDAFARQPDYCVASGSATDRSRRTASRCPTPPRAATLTWRSARSDKWQQFRTTTRDPPPTTRSGWPPTTGRSCICSGR